MPKLTELLSSLNIQYKQLALYQLAFTHTSIHTHGYQLGQDYERLEFMGDAFISMVVAHLIYEYHPQWGQGELSKMRAKLVQTDALVRHAQRLKLADYIEIGPSIKRAMVAQSKKILEDVFEAFMGAVYLDLGFEKAFAFVAPFFIDDVKAISIDDLTDYKTRLQEDMQAEFREAVEYVKISEEGPAHERVFTYQVLFKGIVLGEGVGPSKKIAEQRAAQNALAKKVV